MRYAAADAASEGRARKVATFLLLGLLVLLLAAAVTWNVLRGRAERVAPVTRSTSDFIVTWRCLGCDATTEDVAAAGPRRCPKCGKDQYYASIAFMCSRHGTVRVAFNYDPNGEPSQVRVDGRDWVPYLDDKGHSGLHCPQCDELMLPAEAPRQRDTAESPPPA